MSGVVAVMLVTGTASGQSSTISPGSRGTSTPQSTQLATPMATNPDGATIPSSAVFMQIWDEARRVCVPITYGQFGDGSVTFETTDPAELEALIQQLGLSQGPIAIAVVSTPSMLLLPTAAVVSRKSPPTDVDVPAVIAINEKSRVATMRGLPGEARNSLTDPGGDRFVLATWRDGRWIDIGSNIDPIVGACKIGWIGPNARTSFATNLAATPIFGESNSRTSRWPIWKVRLPKLSHGWYRLSTRVGLPGNPNASAGATFRV